MDHFKSISSCLVKGLLAVRRYLANQCVSSGNRGSKLPIWTDFRQSNNTNTLVRVSSVGTIQANNI